LRVNAIHPGIVGDSPYWAAKPKEVLDKYRVRIPLGVTIDDVVDASAFFTRKPRGDRRQPLG
jgi:NAD(P)-dependent dehydrogenase (short-subunit alcohol dehydrogenase family)